MQRDKKNPDWEIVYLTLQSSIGTGVSNIVVKDLTAAEGIVAILVRLVNVESRQSGRSQVRIRDEVLSSWNCCR